MYAVPKRQPEVSIAVVELRRFRLDRDARVRYETLDFELERGGK